jgi:small subunit ribosomal protein S17
MTDRKKRKIRIGKVVSNRMQKTIVVVVQRLLRHSVYQKTVKKSSKLYAHDEKGECQIGDLVKVMETRPLSKLKRWRLIEIVEKAK